MEGLEEKEGKLEARELADYYPIEKFSEGYTATEQTFIVSIIV